MLLDDLQKELAQHNLGENLSRKEKSSGPRKLKDCIPFSCTLSRTSMGVFVLHESKTGSMNMEI